jgi:hypothetical protein
LVGFAQCAYLLLEMLVSTVVLQAEVRDNHPEVMQLLQDYAAAKAAAQQHPAPQLNGIDRQTVALTPLGTCSACPSNHRNVSSYYLDMFDKGGLLLDCGEHGMHDMKHHLVCLWLCACVWMHPHTGCSSPCHICTSSCL